MICRHLRVHKGIRMSTRRSSSVQAVRAVRTPDERFQGFKQYPFEPKYTDIQYSSGSDSDSGNDPNLRMHYIDEGPRDGEVVLCLHGQPTWSYLYRHMIPPLTQAGYRVIAPDLIGFGKSDKLTERSAYTYANHVFWLEDFVNKLKLSDVTLVAQDWGGLLGLRVLAQNTEKFARVVVANTGLPDNSTNMSRFMALPMRLYYSMIPALPIREVFEHIKANRFKMGFFYWIKHCDKFPNMTVSDIVYGSLPQIIKDRDDQSSDEIRRAYDAPFPSEEYMQGAREFPKLVPIFPDDREIEHNRIAWKKLEAFDKPLLTSFSDNDPVTRGAHRRFQNSVPGAAKQKHVSLRGGHFLQEEVPEEFSQAIISFCRENPILTASSKEQY